ncbi:MAG: hypothetical protein ACRDUV_14750 [Pseudonocardiaceae bacterium]
MQIHQHTDRADQAFSGIPIGDDLTGNTVSSSSDSSPSKTWYKVAWTERLTAVFPRYPKK